MNQYRSRINRVIDHIEEHLGENLSLEELAEIACFSPYHFHRIFQVSQGETLGQFIQRVRLERSAVLLCSQQKAPIIDIALQCGFSNPSAFSRAFSQRFNCTPSQWRKGEGRDSNLSTVVSNTGKDSGEWKPYIEFNQGEQLWRMQKGDETRLVRVKELPDWELLYYRYQGPYQGDAQLFERLWSKLYQWAAARDLITPESQFLCLYHDPPDLTDQNLLRVTLAMTVPPEVEGDGEISRMTLKGQRYACARFRLGPKDYGEAWSWVYGEWLPHSGYMPANANAFEWYPQEQDRSDGKETVDICVPLELLRT